MLQPMNRTNVAHEVISRIMLMIQSGVVKPGDRLPSERSLSETLHVSRSSVRSATQILAFNKILDIRPGSGIYFRNVPDHVMETVMRISSPLSVSNMNGFVQLNEIRLLLEPAVGRLAAIYITDEQLEKLEDALQRMEEHVQSKSYGGYGFEDMNFHRLCAEATGNLYLYRMAGEYCHDMSFLFAFGMTPNLEEESLAQHKEILASLRLHDPVKAESLMREHVLYSLRKNFGYLHNQTDAPRPGVLV